MSTTFSPSTLCSVGMISLAPKREQSCCPSVRLFANRKSASTISKQDHRCRSTLHAECSARKAHCKNVPATTKAKRYYHRGQQYSITALTDSNGNVTERYAYTAYGTPTITDGAGATRTTSADNNRYMYTGREWDEKLSLYHFRARMYDSISGRFLSRDPIGYWDGQSLYRAYFHNQYSDPSGALVAYLGNLQTGNCFGRRTASPIKFRVQPKGTNPDFGFLVQKSTACVWRTKCDSCKGCLTRTPREDIARLFDIDAPKDPGFISMGEGLECKSFYEIIPPKRSRTEGMAYYPGSTFSKQDTFHISHDMGTCGTAILFGEVRYYEKSVTGPLIKTTGVSIEVGGMTIGSGAFPASLNEPAFWSQKQPTSGSVMHLLATDWQCCKNKDTNQFYVHSKHWVNYGRFPRK